MTAAQLVGLRDYRIVRAPAPEPGDDQALVRITHVGICGSDSSFWKLKHTLNELHPLPAPPGSHGHEAVGRVERVGKNVRGVAVGDQVVRINLVAERDWDMRCFAEYALADRPVVVNGADPRAVCFADPLAVAMIHVQALFYPNLVSLPDVRTPADLERIHVPPALCVGGEPFVVIRGMGFIGVLAAWLLQRHGVAPVGLEIVPAKIDAARAFGIECWDAKEPDAIARIREKHGPAVAALECCGASDVDDLVGALGDQGVCVLMGTSRRDVALTYRPLRERGVTIVCPSNAALQTQIGFNYWEPAARLLQRGTIAPQPMIDAEFRLDELQHALEEVEAHPEWRRALIRVSEDA
jgi:L-iditol 2-dehydrogenase